MVAAEVIAWLLTAYAVVGLLFAFVFISVGIHHVDSLAKGSTWGFRLIILPGVAGLWPLLMRRWISGSGEPPIERNAHRNHANSGGR